MYVSCMRVLVSYVNEAARFTFRLGPPTCFPPGNLPVTEGLSTSRSGDELSLVAWDLLHALRRSPRRDSHPLV